jgi:hypothetical protein
MRKCTAGPLQFSAAVMLLLWNANRWRKFLISWNSGGVNCCSARVRFWHKADIRCLILLCRTICTQFPVVC